MDNADQCISALIARGKNSSAYGAVEWASSRWDVSASERSRQRSHKGRTPFLNFTQHKRADSIERTGLPFDNGRDFDDLVKAIVRCRYEIGGQCYENQMEIVRAFRYLYDVLQDLDYDLRAVRREHFDRAADLISERESEMSAYKQHEKLEEIARIVDENGLAPNRLDWSWPKRRRPSSMSDDRLHDDEARTARKSKLPGEGILEGIGHLYQTIPRDCWADRVRICLVAILVMTGLRIGELLTLPALRVRHEEKTGRRYLMYYPEKRSPPSKKWLLTASGELLESIVDELLALTSEARAVAKWLFKHPGEAYLPDAEGTADSVKVSEIWRLVGVTQDAVAGFCRTRGLPDAMDASIRIDALSTVLALERHDDPVLTVTSTGLRLELKDSLACAFKHAFHVGRATLKYVVLPITAGQIADFISGRPGCLSVFQRYEVCSDSGEQLRVSSHAFRHWLNDLLDRGGLSDLEQARYFGRKHIGDNRAYQHMTHSDRVRQVREDLKGGTIVGPVAEATRRLPVDRRDAYLEARVRAVHVTPGGLCFHEFASTPCPHHMACKNGCGDFHWLRNDAVQKQELEFEESIVAIAVETAKAELDAGTWGANSWLVHNEEKLTQIRRILAGSEISGDRVP